MVDVVEVLSSEAAKLVATAVVGRVDKGLTRLCGMVRAKLGSVPDAVSEIRAQVLAACADDPDFAAELMEALAVLNVGGRRAHSPEGILEFRNHVQYLTSPPESGLRLICGPAGSGKTELARQMFGRVSDRFPAGGIEIDLAQYRTGDVLDLAAVKQAVLRKLGIADSEIAVDDAGLDQQFGSVLSTRLFALILDNVVSARDLEPFLPFRMSLVLGITSNLTRELSALDRARILLRGLDPAGAQEMLADYCGAVRLGEEPAATATLLELSGRMPSAVREIGLTLARRVGEPYPVAALLTQYQQTGIVDAEGVIKDSLHRTFEGLAPETEQAVRLLARFPGGWFTRPTAAAYLGDGGEKTFDAVVDAQLTVAQGGWFRLTTLVGQYASRLPVEQDAALVRLLRDVRDHVVAADLHGDEPGRPGRLREYVVPIGLSWTLPEDRFDWLGRHLGLIAELVRAAFWRQRYKEVCQLAGAIEVLINQRWLWREFAEISDWAVQAATALHAQRSGGKALLARTLSMRAKARYLARWFEPAQADLEQAWQLAKSPDIPSWRGQRLRSSVAEFWGRFYEEQADALGAPHRLTVSQLQQRTRLLGEAESWMRIAVAVDEEIDHGYALAIHLRMLALILVKTGRAGEAIAEANRALDHAAGRNLSRLDMVAARAYLADGDPVQARQCWSRAHAQLQASRADQYQWELREIEAALLGAEGDVDGARTVWGQLVYDAFRTGHPRANDYVTGYESIP